eukprot:TRINITY_DN5284_c0_g1_i1.p1 TRINITY_DN5284_c0_g1~~TRINITY_DN5284_c0_g1_i1.p1  ORF type:complete len:610 (+),score=213.61 TRINITY_DN5284_c0_g1_i1:262-2091(+)
MPTITVNRSKFFKNLGQEMTDEQFADLCFDFGIELDDITSEKMIEAKQNNLQYDLKNENPEEILYKIDVPANRYDLLCIEGLVRALRIFIGKEDPPKYTTTPSKVTIKATKEVKKVREVVVCAVLRNIKFDQERYNSFIDLQEKLHKNICRERKLASIGTHDLDSLSPPFIYDARSPSQIVFTPLQKNSIKEWAIKHNTDPLTPINAIQLFEILKTDEQLKKYLKLIESEEKWPVIVDSKGVVLSLPPILNGEHSKIKLTTQNVFIEVTALDNTKANIVLNTIVSMFSSYCSSPFSVEKVNVEIEGGEKRETPELGGYKMEASKDYIEKGLGLKLENSKISELLHKMCLHVDNINGDTLSIQVPITRSDVMQQCDIWEDVAIAYGLNNLPIRIPSTKCFGKQNKLNQFSDQLRSQVAMSGYLEVLTECLISIEDNFTNMGIEYKEGESNAVVLERSTTKMKDSFEIARTHLLPCLLKTARKNKSYSLPIQLFEISDVVLKDKNTDTGAKNERHLCVFYCSTSSGLEVVHGLLDRVMLLLQISPFFSNKIVGSYKLIKVIDPSYLYAAEIRLDGLDVSLGRIGIIHPDVLSKFELTNPCSAFEINIEPFL